jgi:hypothetical protein
MKGLPTVSRSYEQNPSILQGADCKIRIGCKMSFGLHDGAPAGLIATAAVARLAALRGG